MHEGRGPDRPAVSEIKAALEAVTSSEAFARSERARSLLSYLVEAELAGQADRLKGFVIGQDVFGKDDDFDPSMDAVVRVQAGRLRDLLVAYYAGEGRNSPIEIKVPKGSYVPTYHRRVHANGGARIISDLDFGASGSALKLEPLPPRRAAPSIEAGSPTFKATPQGGPAAIPGVDIADDNLLTNYVVRNVRRFWMALGTIMVLLGAILIVVLLPDPKPPQIVPTTPGSLPTIAVRATGDASQEVATIAGGLRGALAQFPTVTQIASARANQDLPDYALTVEQVGADGISIALVQMASDSVIWQHTEPVVASVADFAGPLTELLTASGVLYADAYGRNAIGGLARCLYLSSRFYLRQDGDRFREAYQCFEELPPVDRNHPLAHAELAGLVNETVNDNYGYPADASIKKALDMARVSVERGPAYASSHRALGSILAARKENVAAVSAMREAVRLSPLDQTMAAALGYALFNNGEYGEAATTLSVAGTKMRLHPKWWDYTLLLSAFMDGRTDLMREAADGLAGETRSYYVAARIIAADTAGDTVLRDTLIAELGASNTSLAKDPVAYYSRRFPGPLGEKLLEALRKAGYAR